jgi:hypothetical protein
MEEVTETIKTLKFVIKALETEIECIKASQCGGCKVRVKACFTETAANKSIELEAYESTYNNGQGGGRQ